MCAIPSTNPSPILNEDKDALNWLCLKSFVEAFGKAAPPDEYYVDPKIHFLCDYCPPYYTQKIQSIVPSHWISEIEYTRLGINGTALRSYELAKQQDDITLFQECDYLYRPYVMSTYIEAIKTLGLVSPYDHKNFYMDSSIHSETVNIKLVDDYHYRSTERNTMTFAVAPSVLVSGFDIFMKYGYLDSDVWHELRAKGHQLYVPIPSFATHMARDWLAPSVEWQSLWKTLI